MASLRDIKRRIVSVKNTRQITKAMKLVAAAKLRRAQENVLASRPYATKMSEVLASLSARRKDSDHPLMAKREEKNVLILLITSDKGLCGAFNANLYKAANRLIHESEGKGIFMVTAGRKGRDYFRKRNVVMMESWVDYFRNLDYQLASKVARELSKAYTSEKVDRAYIVYNEFKSVLTQKVVARQILPIDSETSDNPDQEAKPGLEIDYLYEPSAAEIFSEILEKYLEVTIFQALLESWASENGSRMAAMDSATRNASDMIDKLTMKYNRARQAAITTELIEIVSGADALQG